MALTQSYICGKADAQLIYQTIGDYFDYISQKHADSEALVVAHQDIRWTYATLKQKVDELATGLLALGITSGDRVGIWGPNSYEWTVTQFATAKIGAIMVCLNPAYRLRELEYALNKVECKAIVCAEQFKTSSYPKMLQQLIPELAHCEPGKIESSVTPHLRSIIKMGNSTVPGMLNYERVTQMGGDAERNQMATITSQLLPDDPINIQFTSGTTGQPKGATLTHCNILNNGFLAGEGMRLSPSDRVCIPVPLYHCFGMVLGNLSCIAHGATMIYPNDAFDALTTLQVVEKERCTALHGVPTMFISELDHADFKQFDLSSLRTGIMAGSLCPAEVMKRVINEMHMEHVLIGYGQTELSPLNHLTLPEDPLQKRVETVGRVMSRIEVKLVDEYNRVIPIGERGEVCTRGYSVMRGYWNDPIRTAETIDAGGWLHSGDIGIMDEDGYVTIVGRSKDMIIRGGENIYPKEIEEFLYTHPAVQDIQVFGIAHTDFGEEVCAWICLKPGSSACATEITDFCKNQIAHFKIPKHIRFVEEFPLTVTGKVQKFKMREVMELEISQVSPSSSPSK
ncbi:fatty-acyl-CoA synthase [Paraglaciecola mesophila KMM 241]|uniref:Fatty-acyl-CoA synthase n=1 Tax=Paraglaciecola mesophila KMM 241 TaxID=1128912 RepID=K6XUE7_9ALTE|nr:AMP-binding protein [Paraglaciecola mesophila]GAC24239.1 fatty-acyl-CoA synthase [Paraglaciecola mesophila KMM 241]